LSPEQTITDQAPEEVGYRASKGDMMTIHQTPQSDEFKQQLRDSLQHGTMNSRAIKIARHANVYTCGDQDEMVYFIESGQT